MQSKRNQNWKLHFSQNVNACISFSKQEDDIHVILHSPHHWLGVGRRCKCMICSWGAMSDLSLVCRQLLTLSKVAINTVYIRMTNLNTPVLAPHSNGFKPLPPTVQQLLRHTHEKKTLRVSQFHQEPLPLTFSPTIFTATSFWSPFSLPTKLFAGIVIFY